MINIPPVPRASTIMWADDELTLIIVLANLVSAIWTYFVIVFSFDRRSSGYAFIHRELAWVCIPVFLYSFASILPYLYIPISLHSHISISLSSFHSLFILSLIPHSLSLFFHSHPPSPHSQTNKT
ncbi:hypothetical protein BZA77DRAFT_62350 [Pyronema omphalodes]|nr:hypothetical protein BZA77DRAFT_62350 [Pyronema omphalodes]